MGYNDEGAMRIVFDVETSPLPEAAEFLESVSAPSNYKDEAKIAAYVAEKQAENLERAGLDVDLCTIVAIGWQSESMVTTASVTREDCDEEGLIREFWRVATLATERHLVGFNCLGFDLPVLFRRSQYLGIPAPPYQIDKYRHANITDLMQVLSFNGAVRARSLSFYAKRFQVQVEQSDTVTGVNAEITGADMAQAVAEGRWSDIRRHVVADVQRTARIAEKIGLFRSTAVAL